MKTIAILALLCSSAAADDKETVSAAAGKIAQATSYAFKGETKVESPLGGGAAAGQIPAFDGKFNKETGLHVTVGDRGEFFRKGEKNYVKNQQGEWAELDKAQVGGQGGQNRQRGALMGRMMLKNLKAPHEEAGEIVKGFKDLKKDEKSDKVGEKDCAVYGGDLTDESIKASPLGRMVGQLGALGGGNANAEMSGKGRVWVDSDGALVKYELSTRMAFDFQGNAIEFSMVRSTEITAVGKTTVTVPEGVQKLLGEKSEDKKEEKQ